MSDIDTNPSASEAPETDLRQLADELSQEQAARAVAEKDSPPGPPASDDPIEVPSDGEGPLSVRQAAKSLNKWQADQRARAEAYRQGLADPSGTWATADAAGQPSPRSVADPAVAQTEGAIAVERQQLEAEKQALAEHRAVLERGAAYGTAEQQAVHAEQEVSALLTQATNEFNQLFADITSVEALQQMQTHDPQRHALFVDCAGRLQKGAQDLQNVRNYRQQVVAQSVAEGAAAFQQVAKQHDDWFTAQTPEFQRDPVKQQEVSAVLHERFAELGIPPEELAAHWNGAKSFSLRDGRVQSLLYDAAQWRLATRHLKQARANKALPTTQRPGVAGDPQDYAYGAVERAEKAFAREPNVKNAARLLGAEQKLRRRG